MGCEAEKQKKKKKPGVDLREREREREREDCNGESVSGWYVKSGAFCEELDGRE